MDSDKMYDVTEKEIRTFAIWTIGIILFLAVIGVIVFNAGINSRERRKMLPDIRYEYISEIPGGGKLKTYVKDGKAVIMMAVSPWIEACTVEKVEYSPDGETAIVYIKKWLYGDEEMPRMMKRMENPTERATAIERGDDMYKKMSFNAQGVDHIKTVIEEAYE